MKVWNIESGPFVTEGGTFTVTTKVEVDKTIYYTNIQFDCEKDLDIFLAHFRTSIEPLEIDL